MPSRKYDCDDIPDPSKLITFSAMVGATEVLPIDGYSQKYHALVGGQLHNNCIDDVDYDQEKFVELHLATELKVILLTVQTPKIR